MSYELDVTITGDASDAVRAADQTRRAYTGLSSDADTASRKSRGLGGVLSGALKSGALIGAGAVLGLGAAVGKTLVDSINAASDEMETAAAAQELFGKGYDDIARKAKTAATDMGMSRTEYLEGARAFGVLGTSAGMTGKPLGKFSQDLIKAAGDLASFNNADPSEVIEAIGSGLRGEAEPLRKYGILLDDATLRAQAMKMGLISTTKEALTPQQKVMASNRVILSQLGKAQGDFSRTSGSTSNQLKILKAQWEDQKSTMGQKLLPVATRVLTWANNMLPKVSGLTSRLTSGLTPAVRVAGTVFDVLTGKMSPLNAQIRLFGTENVRAGKSAETMTGKQRVLSTALAYGRTVFTEAQKSVKSLIDSGLRIAKPAIEGVTSATKKVNDALNKNPQVVRLVTTALGTAKTNLDLVRKAAGPVADFIGGALKKGFENLGTAITLIINGIGRFITALDNAKRKASEVKSSISDAFSNLPSLPSLPSPFGGVALTTAGLPAGLTTAAVGAPLDAWGTQAATGPVSVLRSVTNHVVIRVDGALVDRLGTAREIKRVLRELDVIEGRG